jgi:type II secretory pathway pseudopilin PulG
MMTRQIKTFPEGQSLVELIASIAIMLTVVTAVLALTISNIRAQRQSQEQVLANNLARESVEVVRSIRDSNWLAGEPWDTGLDLSSEPGETVLAPTGLGTVVTWAYQPGPTSHQLSFANGLYGHDGSGANAPYQRFVTLRAICQQATGAEAIATAGEECPGSDQKIGLQVSVQVTWPDGGQSRSVVVDDLLYAWK